MGEEKIDFYCKRCRKFTKISYILTGDGSIPVMQGVSIKCHTHKCTRVMILKNCTESKLVDRTDSNGKCYL